MFDASEAGVIPSDQLGNLLRAMGQCPTNKEVEDMVADCAVSGELSSTIFHVFGKIFMSYLSCSTNFKTVNAFTHHL